MSRKRPPPAPDTDFLAALVLLRNDPQLVRDILPLAEGGNPHAMYALGLIYAEGRGVAPDSVQAYVWLSRALAQGDEDAQLLRAMLMHQMSEQEIAQADSRLSGVPLQ